MNEILKVSQAVKYYGNGSVVTKALNGVSFCVEKGEFAAENAQNQAEREREQKAGDNPCANGAAFP